MSEPFKIAAVQAVPGVLLAAGFLAAGLLTACARGPGDRAAEASAAGSGEASTEGSTERSGDAPATPAVTIEYLAHAAFLITGPEETSLLVDPFESRWWLGYDFPPLDESPTAALLSHPHPDHDAGYEAGRDVPWGPGTAVLTSPGQYVFDEIGVWGFRGEHADPYGEEFGRRNTIWLIETAGIRIAHIGDNGPVTDEIVEDLGRVDILMIPVDDLEHILTHDEVAEWRARLSPRILIPMHYRHDDLEVDPGSPGDLASIDDWLSRQTDFGRLEEHRIRLTSGDLPTSPRIWVFPHSPQAVPPR